MRGVCRVVGLLTLCAGTGAFAAGFYFGENGTKALLQGGAFVAQADDTTAMMHNPAGLAQLQGFHFATDLQLLNHAVTFWRMDPGFDVNNPRSLSNPVSNQGGLFVSPFFSAAYNLAEISPKLTVGWALYGPPSVGRYVFPEIAFDAEGKYTENPRKLSSQRYAFLSNDIKVLYHTLSISYAAHPKVMAGVSLQVVVSTFKLSRTLYSGLVEPKTQFDESPSFDSTVSMNLIGKAGFTFIAGVLVKPTDHFSIGASIRPQIPIRASGKLDIGLGEAARSLGTTVSGNEAELALTLPLEFRAGIRVTPMKGLGINLDFVYQGWQSIGELLLTPKDVTITIGSGTPTQISPVRIPKKWDYSISGRLGASYDIKSIVTAHAGVMYETAASKDAYQSVEFLHFDRLFVTGGVSVHLGPLDLLAGISFTPSITKNIADSEVRAGNTDASVPGHLVGMGQYTSGGFSIATGIRGHFGGTPKGPAASEPTPDSSPIPGVPSDTSPSQPTPAPTGAN
jgi:long-subunit fatty acid transport protein